MKMIVHESIFLISEFNILVFSRKNHSVASDIGDQMRGGDNGYFIRLNALYSLLIYIKKKNSICQAIVGYLLS